MMLTAWFDRLLSLTLPPLPHNSRLQPGLVIILVIITGLIIAWLPPLLFMLLLGAGLYLILVLRYPLLALYSLIPLIPFSPLVAVPVGGVRVGLMEIILFLGVGSWLFNRLAKPYHPHAKQKPSPLLVGAFLLFLGTIGFSWLTTFSIAGSLVETAKWIEMLILYLYITALLPKPQTKWIVMAILLTGTVQAGLGLYQFIFKVGPSGFLLFDGRFLRAYGTFAQPNPYAGYLGLILPLALALTIWASRELLSLPNKPKTSKWQLKIFNVSLYGVPLALLLAALFASQSRGAWLAFFTAGTATVIIGSKKPGVLLTGLATVAATVALAGAIDWSFSQVAATTDTNSTYTIVTQRLIEATTIATLSDIATVEVTDANFSTLERLAHWQAAREMWRDNPWLGVGFGNYATIYPGLCGRAMVGPFRPCPQLLPQYRCGKWSGRYNGVFNFLDSSFWGNMECYTSKYRFLSSSGCGRLWVTHPSTCSQSI